MLEISWNVWLPRYALLWPEMLPLKAHRVLNRKRTKNEGKCLKVYGHCSEFQHHWPFECGTKRWKPPCWRFLGKMWLGWDTLKAALLWSRNTDEIHLRNDLIFCLPLNVLFILSPVVSMAMAVKLCYTHFSMTRTITAAQWNVTQVSVIVSDEAILPL